MMKKEFAINDILSAVNSILKIKKGKESLLQSKKNQNDKDILTLNNQVKSDKSDILVLDQMIE